MLTNEEFHAWCQVNAISPETEAYIQRIRSSQPIRKVRSGISNICGRYPSMKMDRTIQFESLHVDLWSIYEMERDEDVLEYYDQPARLQLRYRARSGRNTTQWHTPDFFVIRKSTAGVEEWKKASAAEGLTVTMPERYVYHFTESGIWHVECQTCEARRNMKEVKDRQKFPSHTSRKTPPPKGELRWIFPRVRVDSGQKLIQDGYSRAGNDFLCENLALSGSIFPVSF